MTVARCNILYIDDHVDSRELLAAILEFAEREYLLDTGATPQNRAPDPSPPLPPYLTKVNFLQLQF
jgi:hypothetical protein